MDRGSTAIASVISRNQDSLDVCLGVLSIAFRPLVERVDLELYRQLCDFVFQKKLSENQITQGATAARHAMVEHPA